MSNLQINVFNDSKGLSRLNASGDLLIDMGKFFADICLRSSKDGVIYENLITQGGFDLCVITKGFVPNFLMKTMIDQMKTYTNIKLDCPLKKGYYYVKNFPMVDEKFVPPFFLDIKRKYMLSVTYSDVIRGKKTHVVTWIIYGIIA